MSSTKQGARTTALDIRNLHRFVPSYEQPFVETVATQRVEAIRKKWRLFSTGESVNSSVSEE